MVMLIDTSPHLRASAEQVPQPWPALAQYLASHGHALALDPGPRQFRGGLANLNYLLDIDGREAVLRRPPMGTLPPGAYDMSREFGILQRLSDGFDLVPRGVHLCDDASVLGAPFQIIEYRRGFSVGADLHEPLRGVAEVGQRLANALIGVLVRLHRIDPAAVGLDTLGRPEGFLARSVAGWRKRAHLATQGTETPLVEELGAWLERHLVPDGAPTLLHNDLKLDNILFDGATLAPSAVLDWDQGTRGDGLFDLATTLSYWTEPDDPPALHALRQMPTANGGFPSREWAAQTYARAMGRDLSDFRFYRVLAMYKLAVIFYQLHDRHRRGATNDARYAAFGALADGLLDSAHLVARGRLF
ncbi:phosphotransferase family protein [Paraburkholderia bannensis]|uniref:phosphotransferase family protein n=1 Tax=Paraburkholderia bannensis TaxID=765414 RepID=UPI002AC31A08|nr:phosphotransferase family protein [Paraburkholderia bannensis]